MIGNYMNTFASSMSCTMPAGATPRGEQVAALLMGSIGVVKILHSEYVRWTTLHKFERQEAKKNMFIGTSFGIGGMIGSAVSVPNAPMELRITVATCYALIIGFLATKSALNRCLSPRRESQFNDIANMRRGQQNATTRAINTFIIASLSSIALATIINKSCGLC